MFATVCLCRVSIGLLCCPRVGASSVLALGHFRQRFLETARLDEARPRSQERPLVGPVGPAASAAGRRAGRRVATAAAAAAVGRHRPVVVRRRGRVRRVGALGAVDFARLARHRTEQLLRQLVRRSQRERPLFEADFVLTRKVRSES